MTRPQGPNIESNGPNTEAFEKDHPPRSTNPTGSGAISLHHANTAVTRPEMPAVRPPFAEIIEQGDRRGRAASHPDVNASRPSWNDAIPQDPITEQTGRATQLSMIPVVVHKRDRPLLLRMDGVHAGQVISLEGACLLLGRHPSNNVVIDDSGVSRYHAEIRLADGRIFLKDLEARNGTLVQGNRISGAVEIFDGDFIQLGPRVGFRFSLTDAKQERLLRKLYESSNRDALTGAYNRKHFDESLLAELAYAARNRSSIALLLFDIDHFKKVNDTYGHAAGDAVLRHVAGVTMGRLRTEDVFARIGGEEFAVLLRGVTVEGSARLGERLRTSISAVPTMFDGHSIPITISVGCAALDSDHFPAESDALVRLADERLYRAKNSGRNRVISS